MRITQKRQRHQAIEKYGDLFLIMLFESFIHYNIDDYESHLLYGLRELQCFQLKFMKNGNVLYQNCVFISSNITMAITLQKCKFINFWMRANSDAKNRMVCRIDIPCYLPVSMLRYNMYGQDTVHWASISNTFDRFSTYWVLLLFKLLILSLSLLPAHTHIRIHIHT